MADPSGTKARQLLGCGAQPHKFQLSNSLPTYLKYTFSAPDLQGNLCKTMNLCYNIKKYAPFSAKIGRRAP